MWLKNKGAVTTPLEIFCFIFVSKLASLQKGANNNRLISVQLPLRQNHYATINSPYAPAMTNPDKTITVFTTFYEELKILLKTVPKKDKLLLLGDFNAH